MQSSKLVLLLFLVIGQYVSYGQTDEGMDKSSISILEPSQTTVWTIPDKVSLVWNTTKIDTRKSIRFFLVRDEMVVQELGSFKNDGLEEGIQLAKNIGSGDRYQVVGIELFPDDKFSIAKTVTPFFSIVNTASDERKRNQRLNNVPTLTKKNGKKSKENKPGKETKEIVTAVEPSKRETFEGRKISYTQEFEFDSEEITVKIWDHGRQDGDIVSIYLNGVAVVSKYYLTYWKKEFKLKLDPNKPNDMFLFAHNLGDSPPNTVSVEITDGKKSENIILNSDLQSCEAVLISVK
ncbi:MAG: hypothetical protein WA810_02700 [Maribacter sp.]